MDKIIEWLNEFNAEYDVVNKVLIIKKPMKVSEFMFLKKVLEPYRYKVNDVIIESK